MTDTTALARREQNEELTVDPREAAIAIEQVVIGGDLSRITPAQRVAYYNRVVESLGLNPYTRPFQYVWVRTEDGGKKLILYATRDATDQLRRINGVSVVGLQREASDTEYTVIARGIDTRGRTDEAMGIVPLVDREGKQLAGERRANAMMKAETKAKRRMTLSISGLGWMDEVEIEGAGAIVADVTEAGEIASEPEPTLAETIAQAKAAVEAKPEPEAGPAEPTEGEVVAEPEPSPKADPAATTTERPTTPTTENATVQDKATAEPPAESQCPSVSKLSGERCRKYAEPTHKFHRTENESWTDADAITGGQHV